LNTVRVEFILFLILIAHSSFVLDTLVVLVLDIKNTNISISRESSQLVEILLYLSYKGKDNNTNFAYHEY